MAQACERSWALWLGYRKRLSAQNQSLHRASPSTEIAHTNQRRPKKCVRLRVKLSAPFRAGRCIVLFPVFIRGQSVLTQRVGEAAAGVLLCTKRTKVSPFEAGMLSRVGLDASQTDAISLPDD